MDAYNDLEYNNNYNNDEKLLEIDKILNIKYKLNLNDIYFLDGNLNNTSKENIVLRRDHFIRKTRY